MCGSEGVENDTVTERKLYCSALGLHSSCPPPWPPLLISSPHCLSLVAWLPFENQALPRDQSLPHRSTSIVMCMLALTVIIHSQLITLICIAERQHGSKPKQQHLIHGGKFKCDFTFNI